MKLHLKVHTYPYYNNLGESKPKESNDEMLQVRGIQVKSFQKNAGFVSYENEMVVENWIRESIFRICFCLQF